MTIKEYWQSPEYKQLMLDLEANPVLFGKTIAPKMAKVRSPDFHYELSRLFMDEENDLLNFICPRGHGKTSLAGTIFPLHHLMFDEGNKMILILSKTQGHAISILAQIKKIFYNKQFKRLFGDWTEETAQTWTKNEVILKDNTRIVCRGTGQHVRGIFHDWQRPTLILMDDLEDAKNTRTEDAMENNYKWVIEEIEPAIDPQRGRIISIGTPIHSICIVERLTERTDWVTRRYSAELDPENKKALWPEWMPWDKLKKIEKSRESEGRRSSYAQEYLCQIIPDGDRLFKREYLQYYSGDIEWEGKQAFLKYQLENKNGKPIGDQKRVPVDIYSGIDPAATTGAQSDYFVIFHVAVTPDNDRFVLPYVRAKMRPSKAVDVIWEQYQKWKPRRMSIETSGQQDILRDILVNMDGRYIPGLARKHNPKDKKEKRHHEMLEPWLRKKKVYIRRTQNDLLNEMYMWPKARHDDLLDGMYYAFVHARPCRDVSKSARYRRDVKDMKDMQGDSWMLA